MEALVVLQVANEVPSEEAAAILNGTVGAGLGNTPSAAEFGAMNLLSMAVASARDLGKSDEQILKLVKSVLGIEYVVGENGVTATLKFPPPKPPPDPLKNMTLAVGGENVPIPESWQVFARSIGQAASTCLAAGETWSAEAEAVLSKLGSNSKKEAESAKDWVLETLAGVTVTLWRQLGRDDRALGEYLNKMLSFKYELTITPPAPPNPKAN